MTWSNLGKFVLKRILSSLGVLFAVVTLTFFILYSSGNSITASLEANGASPQEIQAARHRLGFDRPLPVQYVEYLNHLVHGNFGVSTQFGTATLPLVMQRLPYTLYLTGVALAIVLVTGSLLGMLAARRHGRLTDRLVRAFAAVGQSVPLFVIGPLLILIFAVHLRVVPVAGATAPASIVLPAVTLSLVAVARVTRLLRSSVLEVSNADYVRFARARGLSELSVAVQYQMRNGLLPTLTLVGYEVATMLGGAVVIETIFGWPGIGSLGAKAFQAQDFPLAQTVVLLIAIGVVTINFFMDVLYALVDPRIRVS